MSQDRIFALPGNEVMAGKISEALSLPMGHLNLRSFPDGETYLRIEPSSVGGKAILVATLHHPDSKILPLVFSAETLRNSGATQAILIAPYLAYMRQDRQFHPGEGITSRYFAGVLSRYFNGLVTVDPHLHRYRSLEEVYSIPCRVAHAAPWVSDWIHAEIKDALLIGPDRESAQWVADVAARARAPFIVLEKIRRGERDVEVSVPEVERWRDRTPVLVDDIISTGRTMIETLGHLKKVGMKSPVCIGVHGVFAAGAYEALLAAGARQVVTTNTIRHVSNTIDLVQALAEGTRSLLEGKDS